jgi:hypothetical protein
MGSESMGKITSETKDNFGVYQQNTDKYFADVERTTSKYFQAFHELQNEYVSAWKSIIRTNLSLQNEFVTKSGFDMNMPEASQKIIQNITDEILKIRSIRDQITISAIDATKNNIKSFSDSIISFADLNREIMQSWIKLYTK